MSGPLVTVGIPTYNRADGYLPLTLESALAQTWPHVEVLVSDNGSTDATGAVVRGYGDPRVRYVRQSPALVPNDNFNFLVREARGRYLVMLHDDDLLDPGFAAAGMDAAGGADGPGVVCTGARVVDERGDVLYEARNGAGGLPTAEFFLAWFDGRVPLFPCSTLYRTDGLRALGGFGSRHDLFQDCAATVALAARMGRADVAEPMAGYRVHAAELTHAARVRDWCEDSLDLLELMCALAGDRRDEVRARGAQFLAAFNYERARGVAGLRERAAAFAMVLRAFGYRRWPAPRLVLAATPLHAVLRGAGHRLRGGPAPSR